MPRPLVTSAQSAFFCLVGGYLLATSGSLFAQTIPALGSPSSLLTGAATSAEFFAGAKVSGGDYASSFSSSDTIQLDAAANPESDQVGTAGTIYVLAVVGIGGKPFTYLESGSWIPFDGTVPGLGGAQALPALSASNEVSIADASELFRLPGVIISDDGSVPVSIFVAYDSSASPEQLYFSGVPASFTITDSSLARSRTVPELPGAAAASGATTTARFFGAASVRGSGSFSTSFASTDDVTVQLEIEPEFTHIGTSGKAYVLAIVGGAAFTLLESGEWVPFNGTVAGLGGAASYTGLENVQTLSADSVYTLLNDSSVAAENGSVSVQVYIAYDTSAAPGELYFTGAPLQFSVAVGGSSVSAQELYEQTVETQIVQATCILCHVNPGVADDTGLVYERASPTSAAANFASYEAFAATRSDALEYILSKSSGGDGHEGGALLAVGSDNYNALETFLNVLIHGGANSN